MSRWLAVLASVVVAVVLVVLLAGTRLRFDEDVNVRLDSGSGSDFYVYTFDQYGSEIFVTMNGIQP